MIWMGDEVRRSFSGNNNAYCHDDDSRWFDWSLLKKHADVQRFVKLLNERRLIRSMAHEQNRLTLNQLLAQAKKTWHGVKLNQPDWGDSSHSIAACFELMLEKLVAHFIFNAYWEPLEFELPPARSDGRVIHWRRWIDTSLDSPNDITPWKDALLHNEKTYRVGARSAVVLFAPDR